MEVKESASGSYAWNSTLCSRDVIQRGSCWTVGDGRSIKIWQHHWMPIKHPAKIASLVVETMGEATVDCLVDATLRQWINEMVDRIFIPEEVRLIKKKKLHWLGWLQRTPSTSLSHMMDIITANLAIDS